VELVRRWANALRTSDDPVMREVGILVRPHPSAPTIWDDVDLSEFGVSVERREHALPVGADDRAEYFDSIFNAGAVVGINSRAMVAAGLIDRPVHTILLPELEALHNQLIHYGYMRVENGGFLREARDFDEHVRLLGEDLRDPALGREQRLGFAQAFARPDGLDVPATPKVVQAISDVADADPLPLRAGRPTLYPARATLIGLIFVELGRIRWHQLRQRRGSVLAKQLRGLVARRANRRGVAEQVLVKSSLSARLLMQASRAATAR
jgi:hypothetical protein